MASDTAHETGGQVQANPRTQTVQSTGPSADLLGERKVAALQEEFHFLIDMSALQFKSVISTIYSSLKKDRPANRLRKKFLPFVRSMHLTTTSMVESFTAARAFYSSNADDYRGKNLGREMARDDIARLFNPQIQTRILKDAKDAIKECEAASRHLQLACLALPIISKELDLYIEDYKERDRITRKRTESWIPHAIHELQDYILGKVIEPTTLELVRIEKLAEELAEGARLLDKTRLPSLLEKWRAHFQQIRQVAEGNSELSAMGYTTPEDFSRLYQEGLLCIQHIDLIQRDWDKIWRAFVYGSE